MAKEVRIRELTLLAEKLKVEHYAEYEMIREMIEVRINVLNYQVMGAKGWQFTKCFSKCKNYILQINV